jgi:hypothetical protein
MYVNDNRNTRARKNLELFDKNGVV